MGKNIFIQENWTERGWGDRRHGNNSNAIAKIFQMIVLIVTLVMKIMEYVKKNNNNDNILSKFGIYSLGSGCGMDIAASKRRVLQNIKN